MKTEFLCNEVCQTNKKKDQYAPQNAATSNHDEENLKHKVQDQLEEILDMNFKFVFRNNSKPTSATIYPVSEDENASSHPFFI